MKSNCYLILITFFLLASCQSDKSKIVDEIKKYNENYHFKNNWEIEIVDLKINDYRELGIIEMDSLILYSIRNKLFQVAVLSVSNSYEEFKELEMAFQSNAIHQASDNNEYKLFAEKIIKNKNQKGYLVHAYLKYITTDPNTNKKYNRFYENSTYLLNKDFVVLDILEN